MRKMSSVKGDGGLVLTKMESSSPARMLVCEQYPSIHGQRYLVFGSIRVFVSIHSLVPGRLFSSYMDLIMAGFGCNVHPESAAASAARAPLINSRLETPPR